MNPTEYKGLENRLKDVKVGDRILLSTGNLGYRDRLEVSVYVLWFSPEQIELSLENPSSQHSGFLARLKGYRTSLINKSNVYNLEAFEYFYKLVKK